MKHIRLSVPNILRTLLILIPLILVLVIIGRYLFQVLVNPKATSTPVGIYFEKNVIRAPKDTLFDVHIKLLTTQTSGLVSGSTVILKYPKQYLTFIQPTRGTTGYTNPSEDPLCRVLDYTLVTTDQPLDSDYNLITLTKGKFGGNNVLPSGPFCFGTARFKVIQTGVSPTATITFVRNSPNWEFVGPVPYEKNPVYKTDAGLGQYQSVVVDTGIPVLIVTPSVTPPTSTIRPTVPPLPTMVTPIPSLFSTPRATVTPVPLPTLPYDCGNTTCTNKMYHITPLDLTHTAEQICVSKGWGHCAVCNVGYGPSTIHGWKPNTGSWSSTCSNRTMASFNPVNMEVCCVSALSTIVVFAGGSAGNGVYPTMQLLINNRVVASWDNVNANGALRQTKQYTYTSPIKITARDQIRVSFINDYWSNTSDRNLFVDKIIFDGFTKETEASSTYSTGTWSATNGCGPGFKRSEWLACNGSFIFSNPIPTAAP